MKGNIQILPHFQKSYYRFRLNWTVNSNLPLVLTVTARQTISVLTPLLKDINLRNENSLGKIYTSLICVLKIRTQTGLATRPSKFWSLRFIRQSCNPLSAPGLHARQESLHWSGKVMFGYPTRNLGRDVAQVIDSS